MSATPLLPPPPIGPVPAPAPPPRHGALWFVLSMVALVLDLGLVGWLVFFGLYQRPHFQKIFADFNTALPTLTMWVIRTPALAWAGAGVLVALALVLKEVRLRDAPAKLAINLLALVLLLSATVVFWLALWLPMVKLMQPVGAPS